MFNSFKVVEAAWQQPVIGRDLAYEISDTLRREKVVNYLIMNLQLDSGNVLLKRECARLLSQILTTDNRLALFYNLHRHNARRINYFPN